MGRILLAIVIVAWTGSLPAEDSRPADHPVKTNAPQAIQVFADRLVADNTENYVEFRGNVRAAQGDTVITSDTLKLFYENPESPTDSPRFSEQNVSRIIARGNVHIQFEDRNASTDRADYNLREDTLVLTGDNSRVSSGTDYITGRRIVLRRRQNSITVEGTDQKPVEALFHGVGSRTILN